MKAKIKSFGAGILMLLILIQPGLVTAGVPSAVTYLESQVDDAWITMALVAAGQTNIATGHLKSVSGNLATDYSKAILALAAVGENPRTFGNIDYVAKLKTYYNGNQIGDTNLLNDDIWAILALSSVGDINSVEAQSAKTFLINNQNIDGGWSYSVGAGSDTNDTAAAVMALIESGVSPDNSVVTNGLNYIKSAQNNDGGIGYTPGSDSDSGSDAWAISALYKAGINPATWAKGSNNPIKHLESLQDEDGGFWWVTEGTSEWNNKAMTPYAVIALSGKSYPLDYYASQQINPGTFHLRIEGNTSTICDAYVAGTTALDIIENGADICNYTYTITQESYGPYLRVINNDEALGLNGWLYFVNNVSLPVGAADYNLQDGDEVLWYYGEWGWNPTRININDAEIDPGQTVNITVQYFDGSNWQSLSNAEIKINNQEYTANSSGSLSLEIYEDGIYQVYSDTAGYVRSSKAIITVGDTITQNLGLQVEIDQTNAGIIGGEAIALIVDPVQINFGAMSPGQERSQAVTLQNGGTVNLTVGASVTGDSVFIAGIKINENNYSQYSESLVPTESKSAEVSLLVPENYLASGVKNGELIFWATSQ